MKDVQGMDTIDNGFNIYCYSTICSYIKKIIENVLEVQLKEHKEIASIAKTKFFMQKKTLE